MIGMTESLLYARKAGLDIEGVIGAIGTGAAGSWLINNLGLRQSQAGYIAVRDRGQGLAVDPSFCSCN